MPPADPKIFYPNGVDTAFLYNAERLLLIAIETDNRRGCSIRTRSRLAPFRVRVGRHLCDFVRGASPSAFGISHAGDLVFYRRPQPVADRQSVRNV